MSEVSTLVDVLCKPAELELVDVLEIGEISLASAVLLLDNDTSSGSLLLAEPEPEPDAETLGAALLFLEFAIDGDLSGDTGVAEAPPAAGFVDDDPAAAGCWVPCCSSRRDGSRKNQSKSALSDDDFTYDSSSSKRFLSLACCSALASLVDMACMVVVRWFGVVVECWQWGQECADQNRNVRYPGQRLSRGGGCREC